MSEDRILSLASSDSWWGSFLIISTLVVLMGVVAEAVALIPCIKRRARLTYALELSALLVLVLGISGELLGEAKTISIGDQISGLLNDKAGAANERAAKAEKETALLNKQTEQLRCKNSALEGAFAFRKLAPTRTNKRLPQPKIEAKFESAINQYAGTVAKIQSAGDFEAQDLAEDIEYLLNRGGWIANKTDESASHFPGVNMDEGVILYAAINPFVKEDDEDRQIDKARDSLLLALNDAGIIGVREEPMAIGWRGISSPNFSADGRSWNGNRGFMYITVGPKPITEALAKSVAACD